jgi:hypothetical protein
VQGLFVNGGSNIIPSGQAYFIYSDENQTFTINNNARLHSNISFTKQQTSNDNQLLISVDANGYSDEVLLHFDQASAPGYDSGNDALKLAGLPEAPQLSLISGNNYLSINNMPVSDQYTTVPLLFSINTACTVSFTASGIQNIDPDMDVFFDDLLLNQTINLRNQPEYETNYTGGSTDNRFRLRFGLHTAIQKPSFVVNGTANYLSGKLYLNIPEFTNRNVSLQIVNATGQVVFTKELKLESSYILTNYLPSGVYAIIIRSGKELFRSKIVGGF